MQPPRKSRSCPASYPGGLTIARPAGRLVKGLPCLARPAPVSGSYMTISLIRSSQPIAHAGRVMSPPERPPSGRRGNCPASVCDSEVPRESTTWDDRRSEKFAQSRAIRSPRLGERPSAFLGSCAWFSNQGCRRMKHLDRQPLHPYPLRDNLHSLVLLGPSYSPTTRLSYRCLAGR